MIISRNVVSSILTGSMKIISSQFRERVGSDKLYHLKLLIRTTHSNISLEKNEVITISPYKMNYKAENLYVSFPPGISINILLQKWEGRFYRIARETIIAKILFSLYCNRTFWTIHVMFFSQNNQHLLYFQRN